MTDREVAPAGGRTVTLTTADGVRLVATALDTPGREFGCVVAHGFTGSALNPRVRAIGDHLHRAGFGVLAPDLRGHGRSGGLSTVGALEIHDVAAAVAWMRGRGYRHVAVLGWSMGGSVVLRHAGLGGDADAVVAISSPGHWYERGTRTMRVVNWICETRTGRVAARLGRRVRLSPDGWRDLPESPVEVVGKIAPIPLLIVHGDHDHYFPRRHVDVLAAAAPQATVWIEEGMGHAETATTPDLLDRVVVWLRSSLPAAAAAAGEPSTAGSTAGSPAPETAAETAASPSPETVPDSGTPTETAPPQECDDEPRE